MLFIFVIVVVINIIIIITIIITILTTTTVTIGQLLIDPLFKNQRLFYLIFFCFFGIFFTARNSTSFPRNSQVSKMNKKNVPVNLSSTRRHLAPSNGEVLN